MITCQVHCDLFILKYVVFVIEPGTVQDMWLFMDQLDALGRTVLYRFMHVLQIAPESHCLICGVGRWEQSTFSP